MRSLIIFIIFFILLSAWIAYEIYIYIPVITLDFDESNSEVISAERGLYTQVDSSNTYYIDNLDDNIANVLLTMDLGEYSNTHISKSKLDELRYALELFRKKEIRVIFRAAYIFIDTNKEPSDKQLMYYHIEQISSILNEYRDVVLSVQAGFVGLWGEWHSTKFFIGGSKEVQDRNQLIEALLNNLHEDISINIRRPRFIRDCIEYGLDSSRLGLHNDALFTTYNDLGTYDDDKYSRDEELDWLYDNISQGVNGGEMPYVSEFTQIDNAIYELEKLQITYLNMYYNIEVLDSWKEQTYKNQNGYDYIIKHLGYRLYIDRAMLPQHINENGKFKLSIDLSNSGFAPIQDKYSMHLVIKQGNKIVLDEKLEGDIFSIRNNENTILTLSSAVDAISMVDENKDIYLGVYIREDNSIISKYNTEIQLANESLSYINGINYFAIYEIVDNRIEIKNTIE